MAVNVVTVDVRHLEAGHCPRDDGYWHSHPECQRTACLGEDGEVLGKADAQQQARECWHRLTRCSTPQGRRKRMS